MLLPLLNGSPAYGGWVTESSPALLTAYRLAGFEFICLDCQHSELDESLVASTLRTGSLSDTSVLVRVSDNQAAMIGKVLDAGADGVIVPNVDDAESAAQAVSATRYPPSGRRSFGPTRADLPRDPSALQDRATCLVMLETAPALDNVEEICAVPGLGGVLVGPGDLSIALGLPLQTAFSSGQLDGAMSRIGDACRSSGVVFGAYASDSDSALLWAAHGCQLIPIGNGARLLQSAARQLFAELAVGRPIERQTTGSAQTGRN